MGRHRATNPRVIRARSRLLRAVTVLVASFTAVATVSWPASGGGETVALRRLGTLSNQAFGLLIDTAHRLVYEQPVGSAKVTIRHLDTLKPLGAAQLPAGADITVRTYVDETNARVVVTYQVGGLGGTWRVATLDGRTRAVADVALAPPQAGSEVGGRSPWTVVGTDYDARTGTVLVSWSNTGQLGVLRVSTHDVRSGALRWVVPLDGCSTFPGAAAYAVGTRYVVAACQAGRAFGQGTEPGSSYVLRMALDPAGRPGPVERFLVTGGVSGFGVDRASGRAGVAANAAQSGVYVFDTAHGVFVGLVIGQMIPYVDQHTGRMYGCGSDNSILISDLRTTPVPAGELTQRLGCGGKIGLDHRTRRVFLREQDDKARWQWGIYRDQVELPTADEVENPDASTSDIAERPGLTESTYSTEGSAFGTHAVWVGGPEGAIQNLTSNLGYGTVDIVGGGIGRITEGLPAPFTGRTITYPNMPLGPRSTWSARVNEVTLGNDGSGATAGGSDRNKYVDNDLYVAQHPSQFGIDANSDPTAPTASPRPIQEAKWPDSLVSCSKYGTQQDQPTGKTDYATVSCAQSEAIATTTGRFGFVQKDLFSTGFSSSTVTTKRDGRGAYVEAVAEARNIDILGVVKIARIAAKATTRAHGRKKTAEGTYEREMEGVSIAGQTICRSAAECASAGVLAAINQAFGGRVFVRQPDFDPLLKQSPGGAQAVIQLDRWEQLQRATIESLPADDFTLPALQVEFVGDNLAQSRLLLEFAGVRAESHYTIVAIPQFTAPDVTPEITAAPVLPGVTKPVVGIAKPGKPGTKAGVKVTTETVIDRIRAGVKWLFGWGHDTPLMAATWLVLLAPFYFAVRRRTFESAVRRSIGAQA